MGGINSNWDRLLPKLIKSQQSQLNVFVCVCVWEAEKRLWDQVV